MADLNQVYQQCVERNQALEELNLEPPIIRIWDGNWELVDEVRGILGCEFTFTYNDAGSGWIEFPLDHPVAQWILSRQGASPGGVFVTADKNGARWSGAMTEFRATWNAFDDRVLRVEFVHDFARLKQVLVWANPFTPLTEQSPKTWMVQGPGAWAVGVTLFVNLLRRHQGDGSWRGWKLPGDPLDRSKWGGIDMSQWQMVVNAPSAAEDAGRSVDVVVHSRFGTFADAVADVLEDARIKIECRRYLSGDELPIPGKKLRNGCLVVTVTNNARGIDRIAYTGNASEGLKYHRLTLGSDKLTENIQPIPTPTPPAEYSRAGWRGTLPDTPWVVLEDGKQSGVAATEFTYTPPTATQFVTGGSSAPGVNDAMLTQATGMGKVLDEIFKADGSLSNLMSNLAEPILTDTKMAFESKTNAPRQKQMGWDYPWETWVDGNNAYTLGSAQSLRQANFDTGARYATSVTLSDACPYIVGGRGVGDFFVGDLVCVHAAGMPASQVFVERVKSATYSYSADQRGWSVEIGEDPAKDPVMLLAKKWYDLAEAYKELGVW